MKFLESNNELTYENVIKIIEECDNMQRTPDIVACFLANFTKITKAENILDPFAQYGKLVFEISKLNLARIKAISVNYEGYKIIEAFADDKISVYNNDFLRMECKSKYDLIVSDLPFALKKTDFYNGLKIDDFGLSIVAKCISLLNDDGYMIVTFPSDIVRDKKSLQILRHFEEDFLFVKGVIDMPIGTYAPITNIPTKLIIFSKKKTSKKFIAQLSNINECDEIVKCFISGKNSDNTETGQFIEHDKYADFSMYQRDISNQKLIKPFAGKLSSIKEIKSSIHRPDSNNDFLDTQNSIFIPKIGVSKVVTSVDDFEIKAQNYIQVILNPELVSAKYAAFFFNGPEGMDIRRKYQSLKVIPSFNLVNIEDIPFILPDNKTQGDILAVYQEVEEVEAQLIAVKNKLLNNPAAYKMVQSGVRNINNTETLDDWIETIPFPVATILRKYIASNSDRDKQELLLKFFEAISELFSTIFLSITAQAESILTGSEILNGIDERMYERASFGSWVEINNRFAKYFRTMLSKSNEEREFVYYIFGTTNTNVIERLCNKELYVILNRAKEYRNKWDAHAGLYKNAVYQEHSSILQGELLKVRGILNDVFEDVELVRVHEMKRVSDVYSNTVDLLTGSNNVFKKNVIKSIFEGLNSDSLYVHFKESNNLIELLPIICMESNKSECHFYSRTSKNSTEYISYNPENDHEKVVPSKELLNRIRELINILKNEEI